MKKQAKKLKLAKETLRGLENRDGRHVVGGLFYQEDRVVTADSGCDFCPDPSCGSCDSCVDTCV